jgi:hypothetical protein
VHKKEDSFIFNLRDFDYSKDVCNRVSIVKVYHLYERRNEWLNWNGDTGLVRRGGLVRPTLEESTDRAEKLRLQGTRFGSALISRIHHQECYNRPCFSLIG